MSRFIDLTGKRFGRLTVLKRGEDYISPSGAMSVRWLCQCDCGNTILTHRQCLLSGSSKSCGCFRADARKTMTYKTEGETVICSCGGNKKFIIDLSDFPLVEMYGWHIGNTGYVQRNDTKITLHRYLMDAPLGSVVDHINHNKLDNRRSNLRITDYSVNGYNKVLKAGKSGEPFITVSKSGYFSVYIDGIYRGGSKDIEVAKEIRDRFLKGSKVGKLNYYLQQETV